MAQKSQSTFHFTTAIDVTRDRLQQLYDESLQVGREARSRTADEWEQLRVRLTRMRGDVLEKIEAVQDAAEPDMRAAREHLRSAMHRFEQVARDTARALRS